MLRIFEDDLGTEPVMGDLYLISLEDDGLGDEGVDASGTAQVTYREDEEGFGPDMLHDIINNYTACVFVKGVWSDAVVFDGSSAWGTPITEYSGYCTYADLFGNIDIFYDKENNFGDGYFVYDADGNPICNPPFIILAHELSHAWHQLNGTIDHDYPEVQAITDENNVRTEHNIINRDTLNHDGGLGGVDCMPADPSGPEPSVDIYWSCFIVSAAYGSPKASQVKKLQQLREVYSQQSVLIGWFMLQMRDQYYRFSPMIAMEMKNSKALKYYISQLIVEPLICYFTLLDLYFHEGREVILTKVESTLLSQLSTWSGNPIKENAKLVYLEILKLKTHFSRSSYQASNSPAPPSSMNTVEVLSYVFKSIESSAPPTNWLEWALMEPLVIYWSALERLEKLPQEEASIGEYWIIEVENWIKQMPIPPIICQLSEDELIDELNNLFFSHPSVRDGVFQRILNEYNGIVPYDLKAVLKKAGYLSLSRAFEEDFDAK